MERYLYKAKIIGSEEVIKSEGDFESKDKAKKHLIDNNMIPLIVKRKTSLTTDIKDFPFFQSKIKTKDIVFASKQFAAMLGAGISIGEALIILIGQVENPTLKDKIIMVNQEIQGGASLSEAMIKHSKAKNLIVSMIKVGEETGSMDLIMEKISKNYEEKMKFQGKIKKAVTYPLLVMLAVFILVPILMIFVVPGFVDMFEETGVELPLITRMVISASNYLQEYWIFILMLGFSSILGFIFYKKTLRGKKRIDKLALKLALFGPLNKTIITALFAETLSLLVTSGVPIFKSLEILRGVLKNQIAIEEVDKSLLTIRQGKAISESMKTSEIYPDLMISMISVGEKTGTLDEMLRKTSDYYKIEVETSLEQVSIMLEPILLAVVAVLIGGIMLAVMLPMFTLAGEII